MRRLVLLVVALAGPPASSRPRASPRVFDSPTNVKPFARLTLYSEPIEEPLGRRYSAGIGMSERFEQGASITIDARGRMAVSTLDLWPRSCPRIAQEEFVEVSGAWQPVLEQLVTPHIDLQVMANPFTGHDDWRADGPLLSLTFGSTSGKSLGLLGDGQSRLPRDLDTAVIGTLEMACSNSRLASGTCFEIYLGRWPAGSSAAERPGPEERDARPSQPTTRPL